MSAHTPGKFLVLLLIPLLRKAFCLQAYGMFVFDEETRTYWFSGASMEAGTEFRLVGHLMGLAIFNSVILDAHFPHCLYMKLLGRKPGFEVHPPTQHWCCQDQVCLCTNGLFCCRSQSPSAPLRHPPHA